MAIFPHQLDSEGQNSWIWCMEAQINQTSLQNAAQREKVALFNHFYEKLAFFLIRVVFEAGKMGNSALSEFCCRLIQNEILFKNFHVFSLICSFFFYA